MLVGLCLEVCESMKLGMDWFSRFTSYLKYSIIHGQGGEQHFLCVSTLGTLQYYPVLACTL